MNDVNKIIDNAHMDDDVKKALKQTISNIEDGNEGSIDIETLTVEEAPQFEQADPVHTNEGEAIKEILLKLDDIENCPLYSKDTKPEAVYDDNFKNLLVSMQQLNYQTMLLLSSKIILGIQANLKYNAKTSNEFITKEDMAMILLGITKELATSKQKH